MSACLGEAALSAPSAEEERAALEAEAANKKWGSSGSGSDETHSLIASEHQSQASGSGGALGKRQASVEPLSVASSPSHDQEGAAAPLASASAVGGDGHTGLRLHAPHPHAIASAGASPSDAATDATASPDGGAGAGGVVIGLPSSLPSTTPASTAHPSSHSHALRTDRPWYLATRRRHRLTTIAFRLIAAVPPVIGAAFVSDLGNILQFTGTIGVAIAFTVPAILQLSSFAKLRGVFVFLSSALPAAGLSRGGGTGSGGAGNEEEGGVAATGAFAAAALRHRGASSHGGSDLPASGVASGTGASSSASSADTHGLASCSGAYAAGVAALADSLAVPGASAPGGGLETPRDGLWSPALTPRAAAGVPVDDLQHLEALVHAAKHTVQPGWYEMLFQRTPIDGAFWHTPYTTAFTRWRLPLAFFIASFGVAIFVLTDVSLQVAKGSS